MTPYTLRKATVADASRIWEILQQAIERRRADGSEQWQDGYPNPDIVAADIESGVGYVLTNADSVVGYAAVMVNNEPEYANLKGAWLTNADYVVIHRLAVAKEQIGKGLAQKFFELVEDLALQNGIFSIKADTNFDNLAMLKIFEKMGYRYCGEVSYNGSPREAYEKVLKLPQK